MLDRFFVALARTAKRLLRAEAQGVQQATDMVEVVRDAEVPLDERGHAATRPQVGSVPRGPGTSDQQLAQLLLLV